MPSHNIRKTVRMALDDLWRERALVENAITRLEALLATLRPCTRSASRGHAWLTAAAHKARAKHGTTEPETGDRHRQSTADAADAMKESKTAGPRVADTSSVADAETIVSENSSRRRRDR